MSMPTLARTCSAVKVYQTEFSPGNCVQAATATMLGLDLHKVPNFIEYDNWFPVWRNWLAKQGYAVVGYKGHFHFEGYSFAIGTTYRKEDVLHMVILHNGELFHDPHPTLAGIVEIVETLILVPLDMPANLKN